MTVRGIARQIRVLEKRIKVLQLQIDELEADKLRLQFKLEELLRQEQPPL